MGGSGDDDDNSDEEETVPESPETSSHGSGGHSLRPGMFRGPSCYLSRDESSTSTEKKVTNDTPLEGATTKTSAKTSAPPGAAGYMGGSGDGDDDDESSKASKTSLSSRQKINVELTSASGHNMRPGVLRGMSCYFDEEKDELHVVVEGAEDKETPTTVQVEGRRFQLKRHNSKDDLLKGVLGDDLDDEFDDQKGRVLPTWEEQMKAMAAKKGRKEILFKTNVSLKDRLKAFQ